MLPCNVANFMPRVYIENFNNEWQPPQRYDAIKKLALSLLETTLMDVHRLATDGKKKDDADNLRANFATQVAASSWFFLLDARPEGLDVPDLVAKYLPRCIQLFLPEDQRQKLVGNAFVDS